MLLFIQFIIFATLLALSRSPTCLPAEFTIVGTRDGHNDGDCVAACPSMYLVNAQNCEACHYTCGTCTGLTSADCDLCNTGYFKIKDSRGDYTAGQCESLCPTYYLDTKDGNCWACHSSCASCLDNVYDYNCHSCVAVCDFVVMDYSSVNLDTDYGTCKTACPSSGYVVNLIDPWFCYKCQSNCKTCDATNIYVCLSCDTANPWMYTSKCFSSCPPGSTILDSVAKTCQACHSSCKTCTGATSSNCDSCDLSGSTPFYNIFDKTCTAACTAPKQVTDSANKICKNCALTCTDCDNTLSTCLACDTTSSTNGWLSAGACVASCPTTSYQKDTIKQICDPCNPSCKTCSGALATNCVSCNNPFYLTPSNTCSATCPPGYTPASNICQSCSANCLSCTDATNCLTCDSGYYITSDKRCGQCPEFCGSCNSASTTDCNSCYGGRFLNGKECLPRCPLGRFGKTSDFKCYPCHSSCLSCTESSSKDCASCSDGFFLTSDKMCRSCNITCKTCSSELEDACIECKASLFFDEKHICQSNCPISFYYDANLENCIICSAKCETCFGSSDNNCASCKLGKFLNPVNKTCDLACPFRYDGDSASRLCNAQSKISPKFSFYETPNVFVLEFPWETSESPRYYEYMRSMYYVKVGGLSFDKWKASMEPSPTKNGTFYLYFEFVGVSLDSTINTITLFLPDDNKITSSFYFDLDPAGYKQPPENTGVCESFKKYYDKFSKKCMDKANADYSFAYSEKQTKFRIQFNRDCPTLIKELSNLAFLDIATLTQEEFTFNFTADGTSKSSVFLNIYPAQTIVESVYINMTIMINSYVSYKDRLVEGEIMKSIKMLGYTTISLGLEELISNIKDTTTVQKIVTYALVFLCNLMEYGSIYSLKTVLSARLLTIFKAVTITYPAPLEIVFVQRRLLQASEDTWPATFRKYSLSPKLIDNCMLELILFCASLGIALLILGIKRYFKRKAGQGATIEQTLPPFWLFAHKVFIWNTVIFFWLVFAQNALLNIFLNIIYDKDFSDIDDATTTFILLPLILLTPVHIALILRFGVVDALGPQGIGYTGVDSHAGEADKGSIMVEDYTNEATQVYYLSLIEPRNNYRISNEGTAFQAFISRSKKKVLLLLARLYAQRPPHDKIKASKYLIIAYDTDDEMKRSIFYFALEITRNWLNIIFITVLGHNVAKFSLAIAINALFFIYIYKARPFKRKLSNFLFAFVEGLLNIGVVLIAVLFFISSNPDNDLKNNIAFGVAFIDLFLLVTLIFYLIYIIIEYFREEYPKRRIRAKTADT